MVKSSKTMIGPILGVMLGLLAVSGKPQPQILQFGDYFTHAFSSGSQTIKEGYHIYKLPGPLFCHSYLQRKMMTMVVVLPQNPTWDITLPHIYVEVSKTDQFNPDDIIATNWNQFHNNTIVFAKPPKNIITITLTKELNNLTDIYFRVRNEIGNSALYFIQVEIPHNSNPPPKHKTFQQITLPSIPSQKSIFTHAMKSFDRYIFSFQSIPVKYTGENELPVQFPMGFCDQDLGWDKSNNTWGLNFIIHSQNTEYDYSGFGIRVCNQYGPSCGSDGTILAAHNMSEPTFSTTIHKSDRYPNKTEISLDMTRFAVELFNFGPDPTSVGRLSVHLIRPGEGR